MGTTALGMALFEPAPVLVVGAEHYFQTYHHLATAAASIHDVRGRIVGLIGIVTQAEAVTPHTLSLVMAAARAITNQLHTETYLKEATHRLREVNTLLGSIAEGVIAWNQAEEITHVNEPAAALLHLSTPMVLGHPLSQALGVPPPRIAAIRNTRSPISFLRFSPPQLPRNSAALGVIAESRSIIVAALGLPMPKLIMVMPSKVTLGIGRSAPRISPPPITRLNTSK